MFEYLKKSLNEITVVHNEGLPSMTIVASTDIYESIKAGFPDGGAAQLDNKESQDTDA
jgi:hypothetical protein